jgi:hypothetical protein
LPPPVMQAEFFVLETAHVRRHGRLLRRRSDVVLWREDRLSEARRGTPKTGGRLRPYAGARIRGDPGTRRRRGRQARSPMSGSRATRPRSTSATCVRCCPP